MYKVFIKNSPVLFEESEQKRQLIVNHEIVPFTLDFSQYLTGNEVLYKGPLPETFSEVFQDYKLIIAAGGVVVDEGEILFIERNGLWDLPKGKLEEEPVDTCAIREVEEECGVTGLSIVKELPSTYHTYELKGKPILKRTYWFEMNINKRTPLSPQTEEGITQVDWKTIAAFDEAKLETYSAINEILDIYRGR